jgi:hypothetical protein
MRGFALLASLALLLYSPAASAASSPDPSNPSLDQYVEAVPNSHGGAPPSGTSGGHQTRGHLSASIRHRIARQGGADAKQLEAVATSPAFGAPTTRTASSTGAGAIHRGGGAGSAAARRVPQSTADSSPSGLDAFTRAATHGEGSSIGVLVGGLVLITAVAGGTAFARRREHAG